MKILTAGFFLSITVQSLAEILVFIKGRTPHPGTPRTILVLGAKPGSNLLKVRLQKAFELAGLFTGAKLLMSGNADQGEIEFMKSEVERAGLIDRTHFEPMSRTTQENLRNSRSMVVPPVAVVTNAFHQRRALAIARHFSYELVHIETQTQDPPTRLGTLLRERAAVLKTAAILLIGK